MNKALDIRDLYTNTSTQLEDLENINKALNQSAIVAITNHKGTIISVNDYFCKISKYSEEELIGKNHNILNSGVHPKSFFKDMWTTINKGEVWTGEICNRAKDGSLYWVKTTIVPFLNDLGKPQKFISIRVDITGQKNFEKINYLMHHDELTALPNRRKLIKSMDELISIHHPFTLFFLDINRFKVINEQLGHEIGDGFLQFLSSTISGKFPEYFFRLHSDEFILLIPNRLTPNEIHNYANIIFEIFDQTQQIREHQFYSSVSIGISQFPTDATTAIDLIKYADNAMQEAKKIKGNYYAIFTKNEAYSFLQPLDFELKLRQAIVDNVFEVYYQPKYNTVLNAFDGMEALIRWNDAELGPVSPLEFITFAEEYGFVWKIDEYVIQKVVTTLQYWYKTFNVRLKVAINISATHIAKENFVESMTKLVDIAQINREQIELEITETAMLNLNEELLYKLEQLRTLGFKISIDDFGTGYSCLSHLQTLPISNLKIDRSFISKIRKQSSGQKMVQSIISLGHALDLQIVAEGVENEEEYNFLKENCCEFIQGYYFCKPLPLDDINDLIKNNKFHIN